jgi:hypothetical protein
MYGPRDFVHPATVYYLFQNEDERLTVASVAQSLRRQVWELALMCIPTGSDGRIGRGEIRRRWPRK